MTFQEYILIKEIFLRPLIWGLFYLYVYTEGQKYRAGHGWSCSAYSLPLNLDVYRESKIRQQLLLQVVSWDWKEKSAFPPSSKAVNIFITFKTNGTWNTRPAFCTTKKRHRLSQPFTSSRRTHAREKPLLEKQIGNALEKGQSTLLLLFAFSVLHRVMKSQSVGPQWHSSWKFDGGGLKLSPWCPKSCR